MIPMWAIPLVVKLGGKLIDMAFAQTDRLASYDQKTVLDKIEENDKKKMGELRKWK